MDALKNIVKRGLPKSALPALRTARKVLRLPLSDQARYGLNRFWFQEAILRYPPIAVDPPGSAPGVHLLTCHAHTLLSLYALHSFYQTSGLRNPLIIHDDGSLVAADHACYQKLFPGTQIIPRGEADAQILPRLAAYPEVVAWRKVYAPAPKILDIPMLAPTPYFILFDSDLFFFRKPQDFLGHLEAARAGAKYNLFMHNPINAYSLARWQVKDVAGVEMAERLNSGIGIVHSESIDLDLIRALLRLDDVLGFSWWMEQTLYAALCPRYGLNMLPEEQYHVVTGPGVGAAVMRHYTSPWRHFYYTEAIPFSRAEQRRRKQPPPPPPADR